MLFFKYYLKNIQKKNGMRTPLNALALKRLKAYLLNILTTDKTIAPITKPINMSLTIAGSASI